MRAAFVLISLAFAMPALAAPLTPAQIADIDRIAAQALKETGVPSASVAVVTDGRLQFAKAYGRQRGDASAPTTSADYAIASVSKQITAAAVLLLAEQGKLSLDDKVSKYLPELTDADAITIRQLLSHTSGYRDFWPQDYSFSAMTKQVKPQQILNRWAKAPLDFAPGSQWQYSNTGFVAAALIVEKASGEPFMQFLQRHIFQPLHMKVGDADYDLKPSDAKPFTRFALGPVRPAIAAAPGWLFGAGQLLTTPSEYSKWNIARIDRRLLKPESWAEQEHEVTLTSGKGSGYGLGVSVDQVRGHRRVEHGGEAVGYLTDNRVYPEDRAAVMVIVNADFGNAHSTIADRIEDMLLGEDIETARARHIFDQLRRGQLDRTIFTDNFNAYLTPQVLADYRKGLLNLGEPQGFVPTHPTRLRGGFSAESYEVRYPGRKLVIVLRAVPNGGKVEQFLIYPKAD